MNYIKQDLLKIKHGLICHQVNNKKVMGAGIAKDIRILYPQVYTDYIQHLNTYPNDLGTNIYTNITDKLVIVSMLAQNGYGRIGRYTDYPAFVNCLLDIDKYNKHLNQEQPHLPVYFPYGIGCGLGGGDWSIVSDLISNYLPEAIICIKPNN